jgi:hypothetical protein
MKRLFMLSLTLAALSPAATSAALADAKIYSAASCVRLSTIVLGNNGQVSNLSQTLGGSILCPLVRDNTATKPTSITVGVIDNSSLLVGNGDISCKLVGTTLTGKTVFTGAVSKTVGTNSAGQSLPILLPASIPADAQIAVSCTIPRRGVGDPASVVGGIKVVEPDPGN